MLEEHLDLPATRRDIVELRNELRNELDGRVAELRRHFDVVAERFKSESKNLFELTSLETCDRT